MLNLQVDTLIFVCYHNYMSGIDNYNYKYTTIL